jgi:hypothetical protein
LPEVGTAEMTIFLAKGQVVAEQFAAGDVGYAPMGAGHYIKNTGAEVCRVLIGFDSRHLAYFSRNQPIRVAERSRKHRRAAPILGVSSFVCPKPVAAHPGFCRCAPTMAAKARI